jgi:hypothetical protein
VQIEKAIGFRKDVKLFESDECLPLPLELVGVELELEKLAYDSSRGRPPDLWKEVSDGSLRDGGVEYVFREPLYGTGITDALMDMDLYLQHLHAAASYRTSVHVHINVSDMDVDQFLTLITLYLIFEHAFVKYHSSKREDNIFCVPFYKAPGALAQLVNIFDLTRNGLESHSMVRNVFERFEKYHALNLGAVLTHGSLEFRHMPGTCDMNKVLEWIRIIQYLKKAALSMDVDYMRLINEVSGNASFIVRDVFKDTAESLIYPDMTHDLMQGARLAQGIVGGRFIANASDVEYGRRQNRKVREKIVSLSDRLETVRKVSEELDIPVPPRSTDEPPTFEEAILDDVIRPLSDEAYNMSEFIRMLNETNGGT